MQIDRSRCAATLAGGDDILLLSHKNPDGDTIGSAFALYHALTAMGKRVRVECSDPFPPKFDYLYEGAEMADFTPQLTVAVDVADEQLLGPGLDRYRGQIQLCIDHHISNTGYAGATLLDATAAATTEIVYAVLVEMGCPITTLAAACLYTGIVTDTGCFRYPNTTANTHRTAALLLEAGVDGAGINTQLFETKSPARMMLEQLTMETLEYHWEGRCALVIFSKANIKQSGATPDEMDGISALPRQIQGVEVAITLQERRDGGYKVSLRSAPTVNSSKICRTLGGGGHAAAAGCVLMEDLPRAKELILRAVAAELGVAAQ